MNKVEGKVKSYDPNTRVLEVEVDGNGGRVVVKTEEPVSFTLGERVSFRRVEGPLGTYARDIEFAD